MPGAATVENGEDAEDMLAARDDTARVDCSPCVKTERFRRKLRESPSVERVAIAVCDAPGYQHYLMRGHGLGLVCGKASGVLYGLTLKININ